MIGCQLGERDCIPLKEQELSEVRSQLSAFIPFPLHFLHELHGESYLSPISAFRFSHFCPWRRAILGRGPFMGFSDLAHTFHVIDMS